MPHHTIKCRYILQEGVKAEPDAHPEVAFQSPSFAMQTEKKQLTFMKETRQTQGKSRSFPSGSVLHQTLRPAATARESARAGATLGRSRPAGGGTWLRHGWGVGLQRWDVTRVAMDIGR